MYSVRLFKKKPDGVIEKYLCTEHFEIYEQDNHSTIILYKDYGNRDGVQYTVGNVDNRCYDSVIVEFEEEKIYTYFK